MRRVRLRVAGLFAATAVLVMLQAPPALAAPNSIPIVIRNARNWVLGILVAWATWQLTLAAARYLMANGDPSEVERAKAAFRSSLIGYALAVLAPVLLQILRSILGG
jgi:hypothetical protein